MPQNIDLLFWNMRGMCIASGHVNINRVWNIIRIEMNL